MRKNPFFRHQFFLVTQSASQCYMLYLFLLHTYIFMCGIFFSYSYFFFFFIFLRLSMTCTIDCECKNSLSYRCTLAHTYTCTPTYKYMLIHTCSSIPCEYLPYYKSTVYGWEIISVIPNTKGEMIQIQIVFLPSSISSQHQVFQV